MSFDNTSILVVDDEPDLRTLYELTLLREGYRVQTDGTLLEAREQLSSQAFGLLITDMRLPDGLGIELLQQLKQQSRQERAIVITAYGSAENAVAALREGAFDYLTKPVDLKQFRQVVASASQGIAAPAQPEAAIQPSSATAASPSAPASSLSAGELALNRLLGQSASMQ